MINTHKKGLQTGILSFNTIKLTLSDYIRRSNNKKHINKLKGTQTQAV